MQRRWIVVGAAFLLLAGGGALLVLGGDKPAPLRQLDEAQRSGDAAQDATERLTDNLERIADNLAAGSDLSAQGAEIQELTTEQRRSVEELAALLRAQLHSLDETVGSLKGTKRSSAAVAELGERQAAVVARAVAALRRLEELAGSAVASTGRVARQALYGARLAEDSQRSFSEP